ncbi:hypothetical protein Dda_5139 [Drechslerella dactyloides]|uniref:CP-type G domain-containing protein n=1 Tax=Drechslerella dactyloides TaxID=74499 RepID=A0AAD6IW91_DREDA|nr:hypothetical protein Dda_5139 [Drechslerella dactyloides]
MSSARNRTDNQVTLEVRENGNEAIADADVAAATQERAYHREMERISRLIWGLEEPIESSRRCIAELSSRPHVLSDDERTNLQSEELLLRELERDLKRLRGQREMLRSTPGGLRAQEIERMHREIEARTTTQLPPPDELAEMARAFRRRALTAERRKRTVTLLTCSGVAIAISAVLVVVVQPLNSTETSAARYPRHRGTMVRPKKQSKRVPVRLRHKIEKKVTAKAKKDRKQAKKDPTWKSRLKKDPGIPNLFPYKEQMLEEIELAKRQKEGERLKRREAGKLKNAEPEAEDLSDAEDMVGVDEEEADSSGSDGMDEDEDVGQSNGNAMAALLASARARAREFEGSDGESDDAMDEDDEEGDRQPSIPSAITANRPDSSLKSFSKHFQNVLSSSDVLLYVLDARDPAGTRSLAIEQQIRADSLGSKRLILLLNKIDLVPTQILKDWLVHLRRYFPTLPIRASKPATGAQTFDHKELTTASTARTVVNALKSYAKLKQLKRAVTVGVVGYPNVGKSSVINAILSRGSAAQTACPVGAEAGVTTSVREVKLDSKLKLLDSPGIVFPGKELDAAALTLLHALPPRQMPESTVPAVTLLLSRLRDKPGQFEHLTQLYGLPPLITESTQQDLTMDFLIHVARKKGRLGKGGVPNIESAARAVVNDWRDGRIIGWVEAPQLEIEANGGSSDAVDSAGKLKDSKEIVSQWAEEFKIEGLWGDDAAVTE